MSAVQQVKVQSKSEGPNNILSSSHNDSNKNTKTIRILTSREMGTSPLRAKILWEHTQNIVYH